MPKGNLLPETNKTEFMRWLNDHENDIRSLAELRMQYRAIRPRGDNFGVWLRGKHGTVFCRTYEQWWLHRPRLFGAIYRTEPLQSVYPQARRFFRSPTAAFR